MELHEAETLALYHMEEQGLLDAGWTFKFDRAVSRFGQTQHPSTKYNVKRDRFERIGAVISLSAPLVEANTVDHVLDTILHEIAHALVGPHHKHDLLWRQQFRALGGRGGRTADASTVAPAARYRGVCPKCGTIVGHYQRRPTRELTHTRCFPGNRIGTHEESIIWTDSRTGERFRITRNRISVPYQPLTLTHG